MKKILIIAFVPFLTLTQVQKNNLPVKEWSSTSQTPFILYMSGDGGLNNFSTELCTAINKAGYCITAVSSKSYFWDKKTPEQTTLDIVDYLQKQLKNRKNQDLILVGYSFGADILPFIVNRLPDSFKKNLMAVFLLSPSTSTDFEIHWLDMLGGSNRRDMDVVEEINKMGQQKTISIFGSEEKGFPVNEVRLKNFSNHIIPGGHHFEGNIDTLVKLLQKYSV